MKIRMLLLVLTVLFTGFGCGRDDGDARFLPVAGLHTIGGTVTGVDGNLTLQNNFGDDLLISADGTFAFDTPMADSGFYSVTVLNSPTNQNSVVVNGTGTVTGSDVANIEVNCIDKTWIHAATLDEHLDFDGVGMSRSRVAMDDNGNAIITWTRSGTGSQIFKAEYRRGIWTKPSSIDDSVSAVVGDVGGHQVAMDNNGNAIIVWQQRQSEVSPWKIFKSEYRLGHWTYPSLTEYISHDGQHAIAPQVAMDDNGNAIIVWQQSDGIGQPYNDINRIYKSEYRDGKWNDPVLLAGNISPDGVNEDGLHNAKTPQVAMGNNGNAIIVWQQSDGSHQPEASSYRIFKSEYRGVNWIDPLFLTDYINLNVGDVEDHQVAMDNNGNTIIVWKQFDGITKRIFKSEYRAGEWSHPLVLADNISPHGGVGDGLQTADSPEVAMDDNGNAIITWCQGLSTESHVFKSEYRAGLWTHPSVTDKISFDSGEANYPEVAMDNNGNAIITWFKVDGSRLLLFISEYRDGLWNHPSTVADRICIEEGSVLYPKVAMSDNGNAVITWLQWHTNNFQISKSEYR